MYEYVYLFFVFIRHDDFLQFKRAGAEDSQRIIDRVAFFILRNDQSVTVCSSLALQDFAQIMWTVDANTINKRRRVGYKNHSTIKTMKFSE